MNFINKYLAGLSMDEVSLAKLEDLVAKFSKLFKL